LVKRKKQRGKKEPHLKEITLFIAPEMVNSRNLYEILVNWLYLGKFYVPA
jgi:hypothetical protein